MKNPALLPNKLLLARLSGLTKQTDDVEARLIAHLAELMRRRLHRELGFRTVYGYVTTVLKCSRDVAHRRIRAARAVVKKPEALTHLRARRLTISSLAAMEPAIERPGLIEYALGRSVRDVRHHIAALEGRRLGLTEIEQLKRTRLRLSPELRARLATTAVRLRRAEGSSEASLERTIDQALDALNERLETSSDEAVTDPAPNKAAPSSSQQVPSPSQQVPSPSQEVPSPTQEVEARAQKVACPDANQAPPTSPTREAPAAATSRPPAWSAPLGWIPTIVEWVAGLDPGRSRGPRPTGAD